VIDVRYGIIEKKSNNMNMFFNRSKTPYNIGLVLSGGGTRGFAHLGVLKALEENGLRPNIISAVSAGSIAGALYADGKSPDEILEMLTSKKVTQYLDFALPKTGFVKMTGFEKTLTKFLRAKNIEDLEFPLKVFAVNMNNGIYTCFDSGPLAPVIKASCSIPILFPPVEINGSMYADGGLLNNFPVEILVGQCEKIIGVNVNPLRNIKKLSNIKQVIERVFQLNIRGHTIERKKLCDLFIEPEGLGAFGMMNIASGPEAFRMGYEATILAIKSTDWKLNNVEVR
jgi:NTE family protein